MYKTRPVVGIAPGFDDGHGSVYFPGPKAERIFIRTEYTHVLVSVGATPLVLSPDMPLEMIVELCDGVVISGGLDINPMLYGQEPVTDQPLEPVKRYEWEEELIAACDEAHMPILGICYGMQRLNLFYGGSMMQDIDLQIANNVGHHDTKHPVTFHENFLGISAGSVYEIDSRHHQAVNQIADGFTAAVTAEDGVIEAIEGRGHYGMQWHPESDQTGIHMYRAFVEHCDRMRTKV